MHCELHRSIPFPRGIDISVISFMKGLVTGDSNVANDGLRRFFEQKFHEGSESYVVILRS